MFKPIASAADGFEPIISCLNPNVVNLYKNQSPAMINGTKNIDVLIFIELPNNDDNQAMFILLASSRDPVELMIIIAE
ncbi:MAG: hypothetical protein DRP42_00210 [Tenericutes bacterium]|nr:MAG: hypothetical protein DRP42_00210 [Mycoplasmatota bacterium]